MGVLVYREITKLLVHSKMSTLACLKLEVRNFFWFSPAGVGSKDLNHPLLLSKAICKELDYKQSSLNLN